MPDDMNRNANSGVKGRWLTAAVVLAVALGLGFVMRYLFLGQ